MVEFVFVKDEKRLIFEFFERDFSPDIICDHLKAFVCSLHEQFW